MLLWSGDRLVDRAGHLARSLRVPPVLVGAVVLGFGTSAPELFVSVIASARGEPLLAISNVVGSNIANTGLILGLGAFLATVHMDVRLIRLDLPLGLLGVLLLILWAGPKGVVDGPMGIALLVPFLAYLAISVRQARQHRRTVEETPPERHLGIDLAWILGALVGVTAGAEMLVQGGSKLALLFGVTPRVIGITVVAVGTSLPELTATIAAVRKKQVELAVGNVAGSNIFNLLFVLPIAALVRDVPVPQVMAERDFPMLAVFGLLAFPLLRRERRVGRRQGALLLLLYTGYILWVVLSRSE